MNGYEFADIDRDTLLKLVRTLGQHRYVASRLHLVHAFALEAIDDDWARRALSGIDPSTRDERLWRKATDAELVAVLGAYWGEDGARRDQLRARLGAIDALPPPDAMPFDERREEEMFPVLIDAGWELLPIGQLDYERHKGAIQAFEDYEVARFEEENAVPKVVTLHELPAFGATELLGAFDAAGKLRAPFVLWQEGNAEYLDYVLRGILRAAKIPLDD